jgi:hypothetical protein
MGWIGAGLLQMVIDGSTDHIAGSQFSGGMIVKSKPMSLIVY